MLSLPGYAIKETLHNSPVTLVLRAIRLSDLQNVILKLPSAEQPRPRQLARLRHEHQLLQALQVPGVIRCHGIVNTLSRLVLVLEDIGGSSLRSQISGPLPLHRFLKLAIEVTTALAALHEGGIIHKDINPSNIVWNQTTGQVQLIDFGIASQLPRETQAVKNPNLLEGTLNSSPRRKTRVPSSPKLAQRRLFGEVRRSARSPVPARGHHVGPLPPHAGALSRERGRHAG